MLRRLAPARFPLRTCTVSRALSSKSPLQPPSPQHSIYVSQSTDPYFNLSLEDWLFRHKAHKEPLLLLYRDDPCVVIGRNQNPWKEVNLTGLKRANVPFIRRRSGGGTVYHDLGNTNYSIHLPRTSFDRVVTGNIVLRAVQSLGIDAYLNDRNDICVGPNKVSGSAYKIVNNRAYHHGTMLISTRLDTLGDLLRSNKPTMHTKGVASVRSPVCNLSQSSERVSHETFVDAVVREFRVEYGVDEAVHKIQDGQLDGEGYMSKGMAELRTWDWAFGQTPEFTYSLDHTFKWGTVTTELRSKHGVILQCSIDLPPETADGSAERQGEMEIAITLAKGLKGCRYGDSGDIERLERSVGMTPKGCGERVWREIRSAMLC